MKKSYIIAIVGVVIIIAGFLVFRKHNTTYTKPTSGENVIVFGDSLAAGQGATTGHDVASLLQQKTGLHAINAGVNGDTTATSLARIDSDVLSKNPKVVIILLGGNDFFQQADPAQTVANARQIVDRILATGAGAILINENSSFGSTSGFRKLAQEKKIPYIESVMKGILGHAELMSDQIHPNDAGYEIMAEKILPTLQSYLQK